MNKAGISVIISVLSFVGIIVFTEAMPHFGARHHTPPFHNNPCGPSQENETESLIAMGKNRTCFCTETDAFRGIDIKLFRWNCTSATIPTTTEDPSTVAPPTTDSPTTEAPSIT